MAKKQKEAAEEYRSSGLYTYLRISSTFGISLAVSLYLFCYLLGGWMDDKFGTGVLFSILFLFMSLISAGFYLYKCVDNHEKVEKELKKQFEEERDERCSMEHRVAALKKDLKR